MNSDLYTINRELAQLLLQVEDADTTPPPAEVAERINKLAGGFKEHLPDIAKRIRSMEAQAAMIKEEVVKLKKREAALMQSAEYLEMVLLEFLPRIDKDAKKFEAGVFTVSIRENSVGALVKNTAPKTPKLPLEYLKVTMEVNDPELKQAAVDGLGIEGCSITSIEPVNAMIKADILAGKKVPGYTVEKGKHIQIK